MSYHIYTTKGLVLSKRALREADQIYSILTRDLGLVRASATGVRRESSKLRGSLEPFSISTVSLVRGKEYWKLTSAELLQRLPNSQSLARPFALLERLVPGEAENSELFDALEANLKDSETLLVGRILLHLGYLKETDLNLPEKELIKLINRGLEQSHLV